MSLKINEPLLKEIKEYCKLNEIDVNDFINSTLRSGFTIVKYGISPKKSLPSEQKDEIVSDDNDTKNNENKKDIYNE